MYYEANPLQFYVKKYSLLAISIALGAGCFPLYEKAGDIFAAIALALTGVLVFLVFILFKDRLKRIAISRTKILIIEANRETEYEWTDVEYIRLSRFMSLYKIKFKCFSSSFYFLPYGTILSFGGILTEDLSEMGVIIRKMKNELEL